MEYFNIAKLEIVETLTVLIMNSDFLLLSVDKPRLRLMSNLLLKYG